MATLREKVLRGLATGELTPERLRRPLIKRAGVQLGPGTQVESGIRWWGCRNITIGAASYVNHDCFLEGTGGVTIGDHVYLGFGVRVVTTSHEMGGPEMRAGERLLAPVVIEDGCWIGAFATILPGVTIGAGSVVGAGATVTRDLEPNGVYFGAPAKLAKPARSLELGQGHADHRVLGRA